MSGDRFSYFRTSAFLKDYKSYNVIGRKFIDKALLQIYNLLEKGIAPYGLRVKHIGSGIYEARVTLQLRILYYKGKNIIKFICIGNHDDIKRAIKKLKTLLK